MSFDPRVDKWRVLVTPTPMRTIVAWVLQPDGEDATGVWATKCVYKALEKGQDLELVEPILEDDIGSWNYELFKSKGCQHCKQPRSHGVVLRILLNDDGATCHIEDAGGHILTTIRELDRREFPIRNPRDLQAMLPSEAQQIKLAIRGGFCKPTFRRP